MINSTFPVRVEEMTWTEFQTLAPTIPYWLLAIGSVEQHGPHLPLGADTLVAERAAELAAARHGSFLLGTIRVGVLHAFQDWPGSQCVDAGTLVAQVASLSMPALAHSNRLLMLNGHDENHEPLMTAARHLVTSYGTDVAVVEWAQLVSDVIRDVSDSTSESHAGEGLTSLFLHWYPDLVRTEEITEGVMPRGGLTRDDLHVSKRAHYPTRFSREDVPTGVIGDPRKASSDKGALIASALIDRVDSLVRELGWL